MYQVDIRDMPAMTLHGLAHTGPFNRIGPTFERLGSLLGQHGLLDKTEIWAGVYPGDQESTAPEALRSYAACVFAEGVTAPEEMERLELPAGRAAVLSYKGDYSGLAEAWRWFSGTWMADNDATASGAPCTEIYRTMAPAVPLEEQLTELVTPLA